ncbi:MAG: hypothetical protein WCT27_00395 [Patescibacteria group bacterium]|jgi:hypothetical protein
MMPWYPDNLKLKIQIAFSPDNHQGGCVFVKISELIRRCRPAAFTPGTTEYRMRDVQKTIADSDKRVRKQFQARPPAVEEDDLIYGDVSVPPDVFRAHFGGDPKD